MKKYNSFVKVKLLLQSFYYMIRNSCCPVCQSRLLCFCAFFIKSLYLLARFDYILLNFFYLLFLLVCSSIASIPQLPELQPQLALQKSVSNLQKPSPVANQEVCMCSYGYVYPGIFFADFNLDHKDSL